MRAIARIHYGLLAILGGFDVPDLRRQGSVSNKFPLFRVERTLGGHIGMSAFDQQRTSTQSNNWHGKRVTARSMPAIDRRPHVTQGGHHVTGLPQAMNFVGILRNLISPECNVCYFK